MSAYVPCQQYTCNAVFNDVSNRNRHEKNDNLHPNCENSTCTTLSVRHHEQLADARAQLDQMKIDGPPRARRLSSLGAGASRANDDDNDDGVTFDFPNRRANRFDQMNLLVM
jgi:hypothetical protein